MMTMIRDKEGTGDRVHTETETERQRQRVKGTERWNPRET